MLTSSTSTWIAPSKSIQWLVNIWMSGKLEINANFVPKSMFITTMTRASSKSTPPYMLIISTNTTTKTTKTTFVSSLRFLMWSLGRDWSESLNIRKTAKSIYIFKFYRSGNLILLWIYGVISMYFFMQTDQQIRIFKLDVIVIEISWGRCYDPSALCYFNLGCLW